MEELGSRIDQGDMAEQTLRKEKETLEAGFQLADRELQQLLGLSLGWKWLGGHLDPSF